MAFQKSQSNRVKTVVKLCWLLTFFMTAGLFVGIRPVQASNAVVGNGTPGSCTEGAFDSALFFVQNSGGGTITFNCGPSIHFIEFFAGSTGKIINTNVVINADNKIVLNAFNERRHFYVESNGRLTLQNITLVQGKNNTVGGGSIYNLGALILEGATILDSNVDVAHSGGAILSSGGPVTITNSRLENNTGGSVGGLYLIGETADATITNSIFRNNRTTNNSFGLGGAITTWDGADTTIRNSTLEGNQARKGGAIYNEFAATTITLEAGTKLISNTTTVDGGGIYNNGGSVTLANSTVVSNTASNAAGGIFNQNGSVTLTNSTVASNTAPFGGGIYNLGTLTLTNSTVSNNTGTTESGGIYNSATLTLSNSTVAGNTAPFGGGVRNNGGNVILSNSTVATNTATIQGGGIYNFGTFALTSGTVAGNTAGTGGGIYNVVASSVVTLTNSMIVDSLSGQDCSSSGTIASQGYNLDSDNTCNLTATGDITNTNPLLGPLQDNGGATLTRALLVGSPAINHIPKGTNGCGTLNTTDQRGISRPQGSRCDIGAYERGYLYLPLISK